MTQVVLLRVKEQVGSLVLVVGELKLCWGRSWYRVVQALDKMQREWEGAEMAVLDYRETKTYVIRVEEQLSQMLDDHIAMTQSMGFR